jgi:hypothetical protein
LHWSAPAGCPQATDVLRAIDAQLGADFVSDTQLTASAEVTAHDAGDYELAVTYTTASGERDQRRMHGESCATVTEAGVVVLALALAPGFALPRTPTAPSPRPISTSISMWNVGAFALFDTASFSVPAFGAGLRMGWGLGPLQLSLAAHYFLPREVARAGLSTQLRLWSVQVGACYLTSLSTLLLGPCASFEMGRMAAESRGDLEASQPGAARLQAATIGAEIRLHVHTPLWLTFSGGLAWIARRPQFMVAGIGTVSSPATFGARITVGPLLVW